MKRFFSNTLRLLPLTAFRFPFFSTLRPLPLTAYRLPFFNTLRHLPFTTYPLPLFIPRLIPYSLSLICLFLLASCEPDINKIKLLTSPDKLPVETGRDVELLYSDSAKLKLRLKAPEMNRYEGSPNYLELPKGVALTFYDDSMKVRSMITANYAWRDLDNGKMEARNNVVVVNERNDKLFTEHLVYEEDKEPQIHTRANVTIITGEDTLYGKGLESNSDFTRYKILSPVVKHTVSDTLAEE